MSRRVLTPVIVTERWPNPRTGRLEIWAARSRDGQWDYQRIEDGQTIWEARQAGESACVFYGSLTSARQATADGSAVASLARLEMEASR